MNGTCPIAGSSGRTVCSSLRESSISCWVYVVADVALKRRAKGLKLNYPEAVAVISAAALDGARAGKTIEDVTNEARTVLTKADVMDGVADLIPIVQIEAVFTDGSRLVTVHTPIQ